MLESEKIYRKRFFFNANGLLMLYILYSELCEEETKNTVTQKRKKEIKKM
jgi:hypothetical protein